MIDVSNIVYINAISTWFYWLALHSIVHIFEFEAYLFSSSLDTYSSSSGRGITQQKGRHVSLYILNVGLQDGS